MKRQRISWWVAKRNRWIPGSGHRVIGKDHCIPGDGPLVIRKDHRIPGYGHIHHSKVSVVITLFITVLLLLQSAPATAEVDPDSLHSGIGRFNSIVCHDVDNDGRDEILFGSYEGYVVSVEFRDGDYFVDWTSPKFGTRTWGLTVGQFDNDTAVEIIVGDGDGVVRAIDGSTKEIEWESQELVRDAHGLLLHDVDGDSENELLVGTGFKTDQGWGQIFFFERNSTDYYDSFDPFDSRLREMDVADIDNDGQEELIVGSGVSLGDVAGEGYIRVFDLQTKELEWKSEDLEGCVEGLRVIDLDDDGILEIVTSSGYRYRDSHCFIFSYNIGDVNNTGNDESGTDPEYRRVWKSDNIGPKAYGLDVGDIDGDGVIEIILGNLGGQIYVFDGITHQEEWKSGNLGRDILGITIGDPDRDGEIEIIAGQGGYIGKGDYTSGYVTPHVYVIDGKTHEVEAVFGEVDAILQWLKIGILLALIVALAELALIGRMRSMEKLQERTKPVRSGSEPKGQTEESPPSKINGGSGK